MPGVPAPRNISGVVGTDLEALAGLIGRPADLESEVHGRDGAIGLAYLAGLTNQRDIKANLLQPLLGLLAQGHHAAEEIGAPLPGTAPRVHTDLQAAAADLLAGRAVLFLAGEDRALSFGAQGWIRHEPKEPS
ncbi:MAG: spore germination protein, partial [Bacteroidota bacterium]